MVMKAQKMLSTFLLCTSVFLLIGLEGVRCSHGSKKLFVFGDSYADTGNDRHPDANSWKEPYGISLGRPTGRWSDGRIFTDFLAKSLGLRTPIALESKLHAAKKLRYGMNFAFGGTGVFDTGVPYPNYTTQIDIFQGLLSKSVFTPFDLKNAVAHVSLVGNDYSAFLANNGTTEGLKAFIPKVVSQLVVDLQRIYSLGIKKISVTSLQPIGCLPRATFQTSFQQCDATFNNASGFHNLLLQQAIAKLNSNISGDASPPFIYIDLFSSFTTIIAEKGIPQVNLEFSNPLEPCCIGVNQTFSCGSVDAKGNKMYTLCEDPSSHFFWDSSHPTQAGWRAITYSLKNTIQQLHN